MKSTFDLIGRFLIGMISIFEAIDSIVFFKETRSTLIALLLASLLIYCLFVLEWSTRCAEGTGAWLHADASLLWCLMSIDSQWVWQVLYQEDVPCTETTWIV